VEQLASATPWKEATPSLAILVAWRLNACNGDVKSYLVQAQRFFPDDYWVNAMLGRAILGNTGGRPVNQETASQAVGYFRAALVKRPYSIAAKSNLGLALSSACESQEALELLEGAAKELPDNYVVHLNLGVALEYGGDLQRALESYQRTIELNPQHATAFFRLGMTLTKARQWEASEEALRKSMSLDPNQADVHTALADTYLFRNRFAEAIPLYRDALAIDPDLPITWGNLSIALRNTGKLDEALTSAEKAVEQGPDRKAFIIRGNAHKAKGNFQQAVQDFQRAQALPP